MSAATHHVLTGPVGASVGRSGNDHLGRRMAAILVADFATSTDKAFEMSDEHWFELVQLLDRGMAELSHRMNGAIVNRTDDGFLALFDGVSRAVRFGQLACEWSEALGLSLRVGVHAGEIEMRADQVAGIAIHAASRVQALADPGEVVVTETVMNMCFGGSLDFVPRSEEQLKGLPGLWRLWSCVG